jgi:hypothetical protein
LLAVHELATRLAAARKGLAVDEVTGLVREVSRDYSNRCAVDLGRSTTRRIAQLKVARSLEAAACPLAERAIGQLLMDCDLPVDRGGSDA